MELYQCIKINDYTWLVAEDIRPDFKNTCAFIIGKKRCALIDTGCGIANIREYVKKLSNLPVVVLTTHVHLDHIGGHPLFDTIYASALEMEKWEGNSDRLKERLNFLKAALEGNGRKYKLIKSNIVRESTFSYHPLADRMIFDLGDIVLEAAMIPEHTEESFVFVERKSGNAFVGDSVNPTPWILDENGKSVEEYGKAVKIFAERFPEIRHLYSGHCIRDIGIQTIQDTLCCVDEIVKGSKDERVNCYAGKAFQHIHGSVSMLYRQSTIRKNS